MKSIFKPLGDFVHLVDERNRETEAENVLGINIDKYFMTSVANTIGTDLGNYKLLRTGRFACNPMHVGRDGRLPVAVYTSMEPAIVSPAYFMFEINENAAILSEYLMMCFRRPDFDRICTLKTDSSVRGGITWEDLCSMEIPVPDISVQRKIVHDYKVVTDRIELLKKINENLEAQAQAVFDTTFSTVEPDCTIADLAFINPERKLAKGEIAKCYDMSTLPVKGTTPLGFELKPFNGGMRFQNGDTLIARITPCLENGKAAYINILDENEIAFGSTEYIVFSPKEGIPSSFFYFLVRNNEFVTYAKHFMTGTSGRQRVSGDELASFKIKNPSTADFGYFDTLASKVLTSIKNNTLEIEILGKLATYISATMA